MLVDLTDSSDKFSAVDYDLRKHHRTSRKNWKRQSTVYDYWVYNLYRKGYSENMFRDGFFLWDYVAATMIGILRDWEIPREELREIQKLIDQYTEAAQVVGWIKVDPTKKDDKHFCPTFFSEMGLPRPRNLWFDLLNCPPNITGLQLIRRAEKIRRKIIRNKLYNS